MEFVCHKRIELSSPELQSRICTVRLELAHLCARRLGQNAASKRKLEGDETQSPSKDFFAPDLDSSGKNERETGKGKKRSAPSSELHEMAEPSPKKKRGPAPTPIPKRLILYDEVRSTLFYWASQI